MINLIYCYFQAIKGNNSQLQDEVGQLKDKIEGEKRWEKKIIKIIIMHPQLDCVYLKL